MFHALPVFARVTLVGLGLSLALAACGRRGPLEPPPDPSAPKEEAAKPVDGSLTPALGAKPKKQSRAPTVPNQKFILDPLL